MDPKKLPTTETLAEFDITTVPIETVRSVITEGLVTPEMGAARVLLAAENTGPLGNDIDITALAKHLSAQVDTVKEGNFAEMEAILVSQITALHTLFARMTERAMNCQHIPGFEANMRVALRAQNQCRTTIDTLIGAKNPSIVYARQANVTTGPQQINNGVLSPFGGQEKVIE